MIKGTLLLIEDDGLIRRLVQSNLEHQGYVVLTAAEGTEGLRIARTEHVDLILLDLRMLGMSGWEVITRLRSDPVTTRVLVVAYTSEYVGSLEWVHLQALGFDEYIPKSVTGEQLRQNVQRLVARGRTHKPD